MCRTRVAYVAQQPSLPTVLVVQIQQLNRCVCLPVFVPRQ